MSTFGSKDFTGFANGSWFINGVNKGKNLSTDQMAQLSFIQGQTTNSLANQSLTAQNQERDIALRQSQEANSATQQQLGILSSQVAQTDVASKASLDLQRQKTVMDEAQARTAQAESNRSSVLAQQEGKMAIAKTTRMRNRAASRQNSRRGLLSSGVSR